MGFQVTVPYDIYVKPVHIFVAELIRRATIKKVTSFDITSGLTRIGNLRTQPTLDTSATASRGRSSIRESLVVYHFCTHISTPAFN